MSNEGIGKENWSWLILIFKFESCRIEIIEIIFTQVVFCIESVFDPNKGKCLPKDPSGMFMLLDLNFPLYKFDIVFRA